MLNHTNKNISKNVLIKFKIYERFQPADLPLICIQSYLCNNSHNKTPISELDCCCSLLAAPCVNISNKAIKRKTGFHSTTRPMAAASVHTHNSYSLCDFNLSLYVKKICSMRVRQNHQQQQQVKEKTHDRACCQVSCSMLLI